MGKRKVATPATLPVEVIWWHDASEVRRAEVDLEPLVNVNGGFVVYENAIEIGLAHTLEAVENWNNDNHFGDKIPRGMVIKRLRLDTIEVVPAEVAVYKERVNEDAPDDPK